MPAKNIYHDAVVNALIADGWTITKDPLRLSYGGRDLYVELAAEQASLSAEKEGAKIAVEVQSFLSPSPIRDFQEAIGQYMTYRSLLAALYPDHKLYMAVPERVHETLLSERFGQFMITSLQLHIVVVETQQERIIQWIA